MNKILLIILISFVVVISGCTQTQLSLNQTLSNIGQVNSFLNQYPNSTIQSALLSNPPQNLVNQICGTNLTLSNVYFVNITGPQQNLLLLLNSTNNQIQCIKLSTPQGLQQPANGTANINIKLSQGNLTGSISVGNTTSRVQTNIRSNITAGLNITVQTNLTGISSISTNVTGGNLSIIIRQRNLTQIILTNITISNFAKAQQSNITVQTNQTTGNCVESWACSSWSLCSNNVQTRSCVDQNNCGTTANKPLISVACQTSSSNQTSGTNITQSNQTASGNQTI